MTRMREEAKRKNRENLKAAFLQCDRAGRGQAHTPAWSSTKECQLTVGISEALLHSTGDSIERAVKSEPRLRGTTRKGVNDSATAGLWRAWQAARSAGSAAAYTVVHSSDDLVRREREAGNRESAMRMVQSQAICAALAAFKDTLSAVLDHAVKALAEPEMARNTHNLDTGTDLREAIKEVAEDIMADLTATANQERETAILEFGKTRLDRETSKDQVEIGIPVSAQLDA